MSKQFFSNRTPPWKHLTAGLIGGLAATIAMSQFQGALQRMTKPAGSREQSSPPEDQGDDATAKAAAKMARLAGYDLSTETRKKAAPFVHYSFGTTMGALYGMAKANAPRRFRRPPPLISGAAFGSAVFLGAHELTVPALRLAPKPSDSPLSDHASEFAAHLIYGVALEAVHALTLTML